MVCFLFSLILLLCFSAYSGELEDFADDIEFLKSAYKEVRSAKKNAPIKQEYSKRIVRAKSRAVRLQRNLNKQGVQRVSLDETLRKMLSFMPVDGINPKSLKQEAGSLNMHYNDLCNQIKYLKEINYSPEKGTLENPYPTPDTYDSVYRFEALFKRCVSIASGTYAIRPPMKKLYEDNMKDLRTLAAAMVRHIRATKFEVPGDFDLEHNLSEFDSAARKSIATRLKKDALNSKERKRMTSSKSYKVSSSSIKFRADRIQNEIDYLRKANFDFRVRKTNLAPVSSSPMMEDEITESSGKPSFEELWKRYSAKKDAFFHSESRIRGVSEEFYRKYRSFLPPDQQKELDSLCRQQLDQEMPPEFARSSAVKTMHTRYRFRPNSYSEEFLVRILKKMNQ